MPELTGVAHSLKLVNETAGSNQTFFLRLADGREVRVESHAANALQEGNIAVVTGEFDTEGVLHATSAQRVAPASVIAPKSSTLGFGLIVGSAFLSDVCGFILIAMADTSLKRQKLQSTKDLGDLILIVIACLVFCPILSLVFVRWFKGSLNSGRVWIAPFLSLLVIVGSIYAVFRTR